MISTKPGNCTRCGKKRTRSDCGMCKGRGIVKQNATNVAGLCKMCGGSGKLYMCKPCLKEILPPSTPPSPKKPERELRKIITCPTCNGFKYLVHPSTGVGGLCTQCRGKGWIFVPKFS